MKKKLLILYQKFFNFFGPQHWWPGDSPWEIAVGAILTQNTNWTNVEKAINNLKKEKILSPEKILNCEIRKLETILKPSGYFRVKAKRLKNLCKWWLEEKNKQKFEILSMRKSLLSVNGIGRETADSILLYAFNLPIFVIDAYTRRIMARHFNIDYRTEYDDLQRLFMENLPSDHLLFNEYHALIVCAGKTFCKKNFCSKQCPFLDLLKKK
ncbi:MAG TPA: hypothetical protein P5105_00680 [Victivallales bacterium]|nr:hypothetical protein [Victivallales bacterium]HPO89492.1 hypothetical protein [Victivallales bacterium]HRR05772.1 hypothetical protein [Victivallales bacterium]HRR29224.1 hypothetical protein [Victivallales bacterium]HRU01771.1 hypothetical protein [Victivallales bacterium]